ncbi:hypothetical protein QEZ40_000494 [Streptomyces katrae]|uniref:HTH cro/C1-type domain-containing protein n=1 Tax=Streptomyces katrae TaxID=68223 RepID=A0ABT7GRB7_9ACTN|nr:helix-turn-helix domain-containing protein [Streptomyces katrae]MDK9496152.1 hypothetical protein [Streptomyces katrae]
MKPIPEDAPEELAQLARTLRELREKAGNVPLANLAHDAQLPKSTLHHALSGERLPSQKNVLLFIDACSHHAGVSAEPLRRQAMRLWREAARATRPGVNAPERPSPALPWPRDMSASHRVDDGATAGTVPSDEDDVTVLYHLGHGDSGQHDLAALRLRRVQAEGEARAAMARLQEAVAAVDAAQTALREASEAERAALARANAGAAAAAGPGTLADGSES